MTLAKAIEILQDSFQYPQVMPKSDFAIAIKLGIEALKWRLSQNSIHQPTGYPPLPGETEE